MDTESFSKLLFFSSINFSKEEWWVLFGQLRGGFDIFWCKSFAVSTPWGVEFNEEELMVSKLFIEVFISEDKDTFILGDLSEY